MSKVLYAGPWRGEFGWELCSWNPLVRKIAKGFDHIIVEGPSTSKYLYEFADEYIVNETVPGTSDNYRGKSKKEPSVSAGEILKPSWRLHGKAEMRGLLRPFKKDPRKEWRRLGSSPLFVATVLCAFRPAKKYNNRILADKEYPLEMCKELVQHLLGYGVTVATIGGKDNFHVDGAIDLRGSALEEQCNALAAAKVAIGPSSGPMHLASLCSCPHITWYNRTDRRQSKARYAEHWNPFHTAHTYMRHQQPSPI